MGRICRWPATGGMCNISHIFDVKLTSSKLYAEDSPTKTPIARFQRSRRNDEAPAMLLLTERAMEIKDTVIISWLFLEKSRRMMDAAANMMSDNSQP